MVNSKIFRAGDLDLIVDRISCLVKTFLEFVSLT
jgi:hypothetical protein